ncbi:MAG: hypothetical protein ACR2HV_00680 [Acidimicrobiales bacterium]
MTWYGQDSGGSGSGDTPPPGEQPAAAPPPEPTSSAPPAPPPPAGDYSGQTTSGKATGALVCAILSYFVLGLVLSIVALILANGADKEIQASGGRLGGEGQVKWARILAYINIVLSILVIIGVVIIVAS